MDCLQTFEAYCSRAVQSFALRSLASLAAGVSEERGAPLFSSCCLDGLQIVEGCPSRRLPLFSRWPRWPLAFCPRGVPLFSSVSYRMLVNVRCASHDKSADDFVLYSLASLAAGASLENGAIFFGRFTFANFRSVSLERNAHFPLCTRWPRWPPAFRPREVQLCSGVSPGLFANFRSVSLDRGAKHTLALVILCGPVGAVAKCLR